MIDNINNFSKLVPESIFLISLNAQKSIDDTFKAEIDNLVLILTETYKILNVVINETDQKKVSDRDFDTQMLLWQGQNTLISSLQLIRQGYFLEPQFLIRSGIESLALALSFHTEEGEQYYAKFIKLQLSGEKCISVAKKLVTQIGSVYGILSEVTHPSKKILGSHIMETRETLLIGGGVTDETKNRVRMNLAILNFVAVIYLTSTELIFSGYLKKLTFWKKNGSNLSRINVSQLPDIYSKSIKMFEVAIAEMI